MIRSHGFPYMPVVIIASLLAFVGIFTLAGENEHLNLVYGAIVAPLLIVFGAFSYKCLTANDNNDD